MPDAGMLDVAIHRGGGGRPSAIQNYQVPRQENQTVLDIVSHIQHYIDPTLSYRFACRVGMCGSCAMMVNGEPRWTCRTHIGALKSSVITIEPLKNMPPIKDLVADMSGFFDKWGQAGNVFASDKTRQDAPAKVNPESKQRKAANAAIECINCGVCYAACDVVRWNDAYLGPAALNRAWSLVNDVRHNQKQETMAAAMGAGGCGNCHSLK
ncbi:MAG: succinate dehydrogenase/fumarate reductase iron-sulfur subunit, partial [Alphaproteobacteria bacterium]|nr:succinate dehydrogenase/fumarate reductase iron-sulfur subunit [Alphaproteobacteria bacterium]